MYKEEKDLEDDMTRQTDRKESDRKEGVRVGPPYTFKLVKGHGKSERMEVLEPCSSYTILKQWEDGDEDDPDDQGRQIGWELHLTRYAPLKGQIIYLPQDGRTVYVENKNGKTVQTFRWPEKPKTELSFRVTGIENGRVKAEIE